VSFKAHIEVTCRPGVLDPQGKAVREALERLGFAGLGRTRIGKLIDIELDAADETEAEGLVERMCSELLAHPVVENYTYRIESQSHGGSEP